MSEEFASERLLSRLSQGWPLGTPHLGMNADYREALICFRIVGLCANAKNSENRSV